MNLEQAREWIRQHQSDSDEDAADALVSLIESLVEPYEVEHRCPECGGAMHRPVSLWRCKSGDGMHSMVGPEIATELRTRMEKVE